MTTTADEADQEENKEDDEKNPGYIRRCACNTGQSQQAGNKRNNEKRNGPAQHGVLLSEKDCNSNGEQQTCQP